MALSSPAKGAALVSVIIPAYNAERYLDDCIRSVTSQTYENLEIIVVNDGSTDATSRIIDSWALKDRRIMVAEQSNKGLPAARNSGYRKATGDWILFFDADDLLEEDAIDILMGNPYRDEVDLISFDFQPFSESGPIAREGGLGLLSFPSDEGRGTGDRLRRSIDQGRIGNYAWAYFLSRKTLQRMDHEGRGPFREEFLMYEDAVFTTDLLAVVEEVAFESRALYRYRQHDASMLHTANVGRVRSGYEALVYMCGRPLDEDHKVAFSVRLLQMLKGLFLKIDERSGQARALKKDIRRFYVKVVEEIGYSNMPPSIKFNYLLMKSNTFGPVRAVLRPLLELRLRRRGAFTS